MIYSRILGVGGYVPEEVVTNENLRSYLDTSDEWIRQRTGIQERRWVSGTMNTSDLAVVASERAIAAAGISKSDVDLIVFCTLSPDHEFPGTACFLQAKLGMNGIPALDIRQQCSGFIYGMSIADAFIRSGTYKNVLLVGSEVHSKWLDKSTRGREVTVLFGDGAGAVVIGGFDSPKQISVRDRNVSCLLSTHLHADGAYAKELWVEAPGTSFAHDRITPETVERGDHFPKMNGKTVFVHASKKMPEVMDEALRANEITVDDVDLFVLHQANIRINEMAAKQLGIPEEKVFNTIHKFGNTTAATIPLGLDEAVKAGVLKPGMLVLSAAFGSGFTWASALYRW